jgi:hypothetical protein
MDWKSSMRNSRIRVAPIAIPMELWSLPLFHFAKSRHCLSRHYLCNNYTLFVIFGYMWIFFAVCVEQLILGHAYDEYFVLVWKPGMTLEKSQWSIMINETYKFVMDMFKVLKWLTWRFNTRWLKEHEKTYMISWEGGSSTWLWGYTQFERTNINEW